jgi:sugar phosphate permease
MIGGIGMALTMTPSAAAATRSVPVEKAGVGSAVLNSARQVGGTMGVALMGAIVAAEAGGERTPEAFMRGFEAALLVATGIALLGALVAYVLVRPHEGAGKERPGRAAAEPIA